MPLDLNLIYGTTPLPKLANASAFTLYNLAGSRLAEMGRSYFQFTSDGTFSQKIQLLGKFRLDGITAALAAPNAEQDWRFQIRIDGSIVFDTNPNRTPLNTIRYNHSTANKAFGGLLIESSIEFYSQSFGGAKTCNLDLDILPIL